MSLCEARDVQAGAVGVALIPAVVCSGAVMRTRRWRFEARGGSGGRCANRAERARGWRALGVMARSSGVEGRNTTLLTVDVRCGGGRKAGLVVGGRDGVDRAVSLLATRSRWSLWEVTRRVSARGFGGGWTCVRGGDAPGGVV